MPSLHPQINQNVVIVAGMPRAGTSWLYSVLSRHPQVRLPITKEVNFYSANFNKGSDWYERHYHKAIRENKKSFDISPIYFFDENFTKNYNSMQSKQKVIVILRELDTWIESAYSQVKRITPLPPAFSDFIQSHNFNIDGNLVNVQFQNFDFLERVSDLGSCLGDKLLLISFEAIEREPLKVIQLIEQFSGLSEYFNNGNITTSPVNASTDQTSVLIWLSNFPWFKNLVIKTLPQSWIMKLRERFVYGRVDTKKSASKNAFNPNFPNGLFKKYVFNKQWFKTF